MTSMTDDAFDRSTTRLVDLVHMRYPRRSAASATIEASVARSADVPSGGSQVLLREADAELRTSECLPRQRAPRSGEPQVAASRDQSVSLIRRGEARLAAKWEMLTAMASQSQESEVDTNAMASPEGLSAFVARVLGQLTLSAWLPAGLLTASLAVLLEFRSAKAANVLHAVGALTADPVRVLVVMIPLLVIATVVTQAFSFEALRTLEGYWRGLASMPRTLMIWWHLRRKNSIEKRLQDAYKEALDDAEERIIRAGVPGPVFSAFRADMCGDSNEFAENAEIEGEVDEFGENWRFYCRPWHLSRIDQLRRDKRLYPEDNRILPTKLGNLMRATEDGLDNASGDVQGFVFRRYAMASRPVQLQHDQFRNRLDMYCTMVFVSASLALLAPAILIDSGIKNLAIVIISGVFTSLSIATYQAAIASANGYCAALKEMDRDS
jgi:hypothetical protein